MGKLQLSPKESSKWKKSSKTSSGSKSRCSCKRCQCPFINPLLHRWYGYSLSGWFLRLLKFLGLWGFRGLLCQVGLSQESKCLRFPGISDPFSIAPNCWVLLGVCLLTPQIFWAHKKWARQDETWGLAVFVVNHHTQWIPGMTCTLWTGGVWASKHYFCQQGDRGSVNTISAITTTRNPVVGEDLLLGAASLHQFIDLDQIGII